MSSFDFAQAKRDYDDALVNARTAARRSARSEGQRARLATLSERHGCSPLRAMRHRRRWTVAQLADRAGLGHSTVIRVERGQNIPRGETVDALAKAYRTDAARIWRALP